jgi:hypothetical protein
MQHALKILAFLPLACATAVAAPDSTKPATPPATAAKTAPAATCKPAGSVMFEIDHKVEPGAKLSTSTIKVYGNGAWTQAETDADGKALPSKAGCYTKADVQKLQATLAGAAWKVTTAQIHCMAMSSAFTVYQVNGKPVFTRKLCSGQDLDENSRTKLQAAIAQVEGTVPATTE